MYGSKSETIVKMCKFKICEHAFEFFETLIWPELFNILIFWLKNGPQVRIIWVSLQLAQEVRPYSEKTSWASWLSDIQADLT